MARVGINPARGMRSDYRPARIAITMLSYLPELSGYFTDRLDVLKLCVASLLCHTPAPYDLVVFDNGSCPQVVDFWRGLQREGHIDYLILSEKNIGKIGALQILFNAAPGEIIAYSDDDIFFYPGWLQESMKVLEAFPRAGMVSGAPVRNAALHAHESLDQLIQQPAPNLTVSYERRIPDEWEIDWAVSTGREPQAYLQETKELKDTVLKIPFQGDDANQENKGCCEAIASANHFQFIAYKEILLQALPAQWTGKLMGHMLELDQAIDDLGYLRLSTTTRTARHLGNTLSPQILTDAQNLGLKSESLAKHTDNLEHPAAVTSQRKSSRRHWLTSIPGARRLLVWAYKRLFDMLYL